MLTAYTTIPALEPMPKGVVLVSIGATTVAAFVVLAVVAVSVALVRRKRGVQIVPRAATRAKVRRAA